MTLRGLLSAVLVAAGLTAPVSPAAAKQAEFTTYEIVRVKSGAYGVVVHFAGETVRPTIVSVLRVTREGGRYRRRSAAITIYGFDGEHRTYGWPAPLPLSCPSGVCGHDSSAGRFEHSEFFTVDRGDRLFVAAPRGVTVWTTNGHWRARRIAPAFTVVRATDADATGASNVLATSVEHFRGATAPGGRYGSMAFALVPCDRSGAGSATVSAGGEPVAEINCAFGDSAFGYTPGPDGWTVSGTVVGTYETDLRLATFAYPKP